MRSDMDHTVLPANYTMPACVSGFDSRRRHFISVCNQKTTTQVDSAFYPPWDGKMSTSQRAVMFCGWGVKAGMV